MQYLIFTAAETPYAVNLMDVERVTWAAAIMESPEFTAPIAGFIILENKPVLVVNVRKQLGLPTKELGVEDQFIIYRYENQKVAMWVDHIEKIVDVVDAQDDNEQHPRFIRNNSTTILVYDAALLQKDLKSSSLEVL